jgi:hypothetical protein
LASIGSGNDKFNANILPRRVVNGKVGECLHRLSSGIIQSQFTPGIDPIKGFKYERWLR